MSLSALRRSQSIEEFSCPQCSRPLLTATAVCRFCEQQGLPAIQAPLYTQPADNRLSKEIPRTKGLRTSRFEAKDITLRISLSGILTTCGILSILAALYTGLGLKLPFETAVLLQLGVIEFAIAFLAKAFAGINPPSA